MSRRSEFSLEFIQAVNDWQIGRNRKRGLRLKEFSSTLDERFRQVDGYGFRRIALSKFHVAEMGENQRLPETIASWTFDLVREEAARDQELGSRHPALVGLAT